MRKLLVRLSRIRKALPILAVVAVVATIALVLSLRRSSTEVPVFVPLEPSSTEAAREDEDAIVVRGDWGYPPFEYLNESGEPDGFNIEILTRVAEIMNMDIRIALGPWSEVRKELENGQIDVLAGMYKTERRDKRVDFAIPHFIASYGVFITSDSDIRSVGDIQHKRILVQADDLGHDYLIENDIGSEIVTVSDWKAVFPALLDGKADCAVMGMVQGVRLLQDRGYGNVHVLSQPLVQRPYSIAVQEGDAELLAVINEGLNLLKTSGQYDEIYEEWFGVYHEPRRVNKRLLRVLAAGVLILAVVLIGIILWTRSLKRQVRKQTASLQSALHELEEANATKDRFLAGVSHELRTPLHGILGITELVQNTELDSKQLELVGMVKSAARQLNRVLSDLIDISRLDTGKLSLDTAPFALEELVEWIEPVLGEKADKKGLAFEVSVAGTPQDVVVSDKERVAQIILNLADNAIKNTDSGSVAVDIRLEASDFEEHSILQIHVMDTGQGISKDDQQRVFFPFTQLSSNPGQLASGLGLGLSIVRSITDLLDGSLDVKSAPGKGSTFSVSIPVRHEKAARKAASTAVNDEPSIPAGLRVLVAEDEAINRLYLEQLLTRQGWTTTTVSDGESAVMSVESHRYDLVLMDLSMPRLGGLEATQSIRSTESRTGKARTPIIALTAHAYAEHRHVCLNAGMDGIVSKPFAEIDLWHEVGRVLQDRFYTNSD